MNSTDMNPPATYTVSSPCKNHGIYTDINLHVQAQTWTHAQLYTVDSTAPFFFQSKFSAVHPSWRCTDVVSTQEDGQHKLSAGMEIGVAHLWL